MPIDLTARVAGKRVDALFSNGHLLCLRFTDGSEVTVGWVNDNGELVKGRPLAQTGARLRAGGIRDIIPPQGEGLRGLVHLPTNRRGR